MIPQTRRIHTRRIGVDVHPAAPGHAYTNRWVIALALFVVSVLLGLFIGLGFVPLLIYLSLFSLLAVATVMFAVKGRLADSFLVLVFVGASMYRGFLYEARIWLGEFPISVFDIMVAYVIVCALLQRLGDRFHRIAWAIRWSSPPIVLFIVANGIALAYGILNSYRAYDILRDVVGPAYLIAVYWAGSVLVRGETTILRCLRSLVIGSTLSAMLMAYIFVSRGMGGAGLTGLLAPPSHSVGVSVLREGRIQHGVMPIAVVLLFVTLMSDFAMFPRWLTYLLLVTNSAAMALQMNRGDWLATIIPICSLALARRIGALRKTRAIFEILFVLVTVVVLLLGIQSVINVGFVDAISDRFVSIWSIGRNLLDVAVAQETGVLGRVVAAELSLAAWREGGLFAWFLGRGHGFRLRTYAGLETFDFLGYPHNSYLFYLVRTGAVGLCSLILFLLLGTWRAWEVGNKLRAPLGSRALGLALSAATLSIVVGAVFQDYLREPLMATIAGGTLAFIGVMMGDSRVASISPH